LNILRKSVEKIKVLLKFIKKVFLNVSVTINPYPANVENKVSS